MPPNNYPASFDEAEPHPLNDAVMNSITLKTAEAGSEEDDEKVMPSTIDEVESGHPLNEYVERAKVQRALEENS